MESFGFIIIETLVGTFLADCSDLHVLPLPAAMRCLALCASSSLYHF